MDDINLAAVAKHPQYGARSHLSVRVTDRLPLTDEDVSAFLDGRLSGKDEDEFPVPHSRLS